VAKIKPRPKAHGAGHNAMGANILYHESLTCFGDFNNHEVIWEKNESSLIQMD
jgi:hypothetical protein